MRSRELLERAQLLLSRRGETDAAGNLARWKAETIAYLESRRAELTAERLRLEAEEVRP